MTSFKSREYIFYFLLVFLITGLESLIFTGCKNRSHSFEKEMVEVSNKINKICPVQIDSETRLDGTIVHAPFDFQYNYTFVHVVKDSLDLALFISEMEPHLLNNIQMSEELAFLRDNNVVLHYNYQDKNGKTIHNFTFTPDMYK